VVSGPPCRPAGKEGNGYQQAVAGQPATRAAAQSGGGLIRKTGPFKEPHAFAEDRRLGTEQKVSKSCGLY